MKKLMIIALLALGFSQEVMPMYAKIAAKAAQWGMSKAGVGQAALFGAASLLANKSLEHSVNKLNNNFEGSGFKALVSSAETPASWLPYIWHTAKWFYGEFGAAIGIMSMLGGAANIAKGAVIREQPAQEVPGQEAYVGPQGQPSHPGQLAKIHPQYKDFLRQRAVVAA